MGYYKVMRYSAPPPGKLISLIPRNRLWVTEYKFLEWAYPKHEGSKLAVFEAIEPAKSFMIIYQAFNPLVVMRLWQVEVEAQARTGDDSCSNGKSEPIRPGQGSIYWR